MNELFGLYLILTDPVAGYKKAAEAAVNEGIRYLQLRIKNAEQNQILEMAKTIRKITAGSDTLFIMNDDLSIAIDADADGVHLGQTDQSVSEARQNWNTPGKLFGLSTHSMEQALQAQDEKPDYIGIGPVYATQTKTDAGPALGPEETGRIAKAVPIPSVAIGGITAERLPELIRAGAQNYCVISAVNQSSDPAAAIRLLQDIWKTYTF
ncbi:thiamine phosphate synthase [Pontiellaceae bacterium B12219]|nr:thiamine phosphate synthase [Pontiellaceae bacterium B12219]